MNALRRQSLVFAGGMVLVSLVAGVAGPRRREGTPERVDLATLFPLQFGQWRSVGAVNAFVRPADQPIYRIYHQVLERTYVDPDGQQVMLSVAFGGSQNSGLDLHRPELCYRYGGFVVLAGRTDDLRLDNAEMAVTRLTALMPGRPEAITYWMTLGGKPARDAYTFRLLNLEYAVKRQTVDGILVRVSSIDPHAEQAYATHTRFISALVLALTPADRALVIGAGRG